MSARVIREGSVGGHLEAPYGITPVAERHGSAGARSAGGVGGHIGAPHVECPC
jgi:hypothetical protein